MRRTLGQRVRLAGWIIAGTVGIPYVVLALYLFGVFPRYPPIPPALEFWLNWFGWDLLVFLYPIAPAGLLLVVLSYAVDSIERRRRRKKFAPKSDAPNSQ